MTSGSLDEKEKKYAEKLHLALALSIEEKQLCLRRE